MTNDQVTLKKEYKKIIIFAVFDVLVLAYLNLNTLLLAYADRSYIDSDFFIFIMRYYAYFLGLSSLLIAIFTRDMILANSNYRAGVSVQLTRKTTDEHVQVFRRVKLAAILPLSVCMSLAAFGTILAIISGARIDSFIFVLFSIIGAVYFFPQYSQFEEWHDIAQKAKDKSKTRTILRSWQKLSMVGFYLLGAVVYIIMPFIVYLPSTLELVSIYTLAFGYFLLSYAYLLKNVQMQKA